MVPAFVVRDKASTMLDAVVGPVRDAFAAFTADLSAKVREAHAGVLVDKVRKGEGLFDYRSYRQCRSSAQKIVPPPFMPKEWEETADEVVSLYSGEIRADELTNVIRICCRIA